jgi:hypothetical protein
VSGPCPRNGGSALASWPSLLHWEFDTYWRCVCPGNVGGTGQSRTALKQTKPPEKLALSKSTKPPENRAWLKSIRPPENSVLRLTVPPENRAPRKAADLPTAQNNERPVFGICFRPGSSYLERMTGIEPALFALSAWEFAESGGRSRARPR